MNVLVEALMFFSGLLFGMAIIMGGVAILLWYLIERKGF